MKKFSLFVLTILLMIPLCVYATNPRVLTLETSAEGNEVEFSGTTESGSVAVMCKLFNTNSEVVDLLSVEVNNTQFEGSFTAPDTGTYSVLCANYEGGEIRSANVTVTSTAVVVTHNVTFNTMGGSEIADATVDDGQTVTKPEDPTNGDLVFGGWYTEQSLEHEFNFNTAITSDIELFARWKQRFTVGFDTRCEQEIPDVEVIEDELVERPEDPENGNMVLVGWFLDEDLTDEYDFNTPVTDNLFLHAKWELPKVNYTVEDEAGNIAEFREEIGHTYTLSIVDFMSFTKEEVMQLAEIDEEMYNYIFDGFKNTVKDYGDLISIYNIILTDENNEELHDVPVTIKLKLTDEMKKFNTLKLVFVDENNNFATETPVKLTISGDYAYGTVNHLSVYTLVGSNETSPKTLDNIYTILAMLAISTIGLLVIKKIKK